MATGPQRRKMLTVPLLPGQATSAIGTAANDFMVPRTRSKAGPPKSASIRRRRAPATRTQFGSRACGTSSRVPALDRPIFAGPRSFASVARLIRVPSKASCTITNTSAGAIAIQQTSTARPERGSRRRVPSAPRAALRASPANPPLADGRWPCGDTGAAQDRESRYQFTVKSP